MEIAIAPFRIAGVVAWEKKAGVAARASLAKEALTHLDHLYRVAFHLAGDRHRSQDMVQETFVRALASHEQFRPGSNMKAWLTRILYNLFFDDYERQKRWNFREEPNERDGEGLRPPDHSGPESDVLHKELRSEIDRVLHRLPAEFRAPILLIDMGDFSYDEAAEILACPVGTIRSRLSRGRKLMRQYLSVYVTDKQTATQRK